MDVDKIDIAIMGIMINQDKTSALFSIQVKDLMKSLRFKYDISYPTIIRRLQKLAEKDYIGEGYKLGNSRNFYLLNKGLVFMNNIQELEDVYIEIVDQEENNNDMEELDNE